MTTDTQPTRQWSGDSESSSRSRSPRFPGSLPPSSSRSTPPTRSQTGPDPGQPIPPYELPPHSRSEDLNHTLSASPKGSRPNTPSKDPTRRTSAGSLNSAHSSNNSNPNQPPSSVASASLSSASCASCGKPMQGPFVRALGTVFHLNCFKCNDCGDVVASKFFPIEGADGKQYPLCERDYFRRLNLICAKCGMALRGSYITACSKKFHVDHFTCSLCTTLFGPQDSYYEHDGDVYCHFHYSTRFATKCAGCSSAILKQFVEINRNMRDECWHPECYMINKFWNVKVVSRRPTSTAEIEHQQEPEYTEEERQETPVSLKDKQIRMEQQVYRIWTVLSAFEESSAACISDMLRQVSNGQYLDAIRMADKFILHVEVLFATIDDLEHHFYRLSMKGMSHVREARMLCRKTVELFTLLSHTQETGSRRMGMTQELLALVTGLAHYLKILIRIALTGALKLERERNVYEAMSSFLDKLHLLAVQGGNPSARRMIKGHSGEVMAHSGANIGTQGVTYGFRSLAPENAGESPFAPGVSSSAAKMPSDLCVKCNLTVEEDCVRLGTYQRWHSHCVQCAKCGKKAVVPVPKEKEPAPNGDDGALTRDQTPKVSNSRRPPANVSLFVYEVDSRKETQSFGEVPTVILCTDHAHPGCRGGFQPVQRLEQYAFLLNVALRRLYFVLRKQGVVPLSPDTPTHQAPLESDPYRNSADIMRMKSVHLDRKLSATARLPKRSTIVESPAGRTAPSEVLASQKTQESTTASHPQQQPAPQAPQPQFAQQGQVPQQRSPSQPPSSTAFTNRVPRPHLGTMPPSDSNQVLRPAFARNNTEVMILDDSAPNSPAGGGGLMEVAQARAEQRSLPRENAIPYIAELSALELAIVKHAALLMLTKSPLRDQFELDELLEMVETKKSGFWNKLFKAGDKNKNVKKKGVFGVPLEFLVEREGSDSLLGATRETMRVPSFIDDVISAMRQMDMSIEGIFRKNGNIRRLKELTEAIDRDPSSVDLTTDNPVQLAALLKKFLRDLPDPLMTFKLHRLLIATQSFPQDADRRRLLHLVSLMMPKSHRDTMEVLFVFLKWVASFAHMDESTGSKMDLGNLATVICPSILYSRSSNAARDESFGSIRVITALLENQDEFFTVPEEFLPILHDQEYFANSIELPGKDFLKKVDTYMKLKAGAGPTNGVRPLNLPPFNAANNGSTPRFNNGPNSPVMERPPLGHGNSTSIPRPHPGQPPHPGLPPPSSSFSPGSPLPPNMHNSPRTPEDWGAAPPRPSVNGGATPSSRPSSYIQPRPSHDPAN
ncbi:LIM-domain-containing protein [Mycena kentingensis (nom. inval.)]|nr:LIM-domain-containing protein [Mycena kentingensis (nom. inval.)]